MPVTIEINQQSAIPKYRQIAEAIISGIEQRTLGLNERLPSINEISSRYEVSRDTVEKAYRRLKKDNIILSVPGKGYFTARSNISRQRKVLLVFNQLSAYKKIIFDSFVRTFEGQGTVDLQVYHDDYQLFEKIILDRVGQYSDYVVIPSFLGESALRARQFLRATIPQQLYLLNSYLDGIPKLRGAIYQDYEKDIFQALNRALPLLKKYQGLHLVFPNESKYSRGIVAGFQRFCQEQSFPAKVFFKDFDQATIQRGVAYILIKDDDLVTLVRKIKEADWEPRHDVGILAYNDTPLKQVLLDGITVMSTDHHAMGQRMANMLLERQKGCISNPFELIVRKSL